MIEREAFYLNWILYTVGPTCIIPDVKDKFATITCGDPTTANYEEECSLVCDDGYIGDTTVTCGDDSDADGLADFGTIPDACQGIFKYLQLSLTLYV